MSHDDALLRAVIENPADDAVRLVYADWLEERGDPRGEFLRAWTDLEALEQGEPPVDGRGRLARVRRVGHLRRRWRDLLPLVDRGWVAKLHRGNLRCGGVPDGQCPGRWDRLPCEPGRPFARYCRVCARWARLCWSRDEVEQVLWQGRVAAPVMVLGLQGPSRLDVPREGPAKAHDPR